MANEYKSAVYVGTMGFPFGSAMANRTMQISCILADIGYKVIVINRINVHDKNLVKREKLKMFGCIKGIFYFHSSIISFRPQNYFIRNLFKMVGFLFELLTILYLRLFSGAKLMVCSSIEINSLRYYFFISRVLKIKLILDYVEFVDSLNYPEARNISELKLRFEKNIHKYADFYFVISRFLFEHLDKLDPFSKKIILPPSQNLDYFNKMDKLSTTQKYFLYCGSISYMSAIEFVVNSYIKSEALEMDYYLYLVVGNAQAKEIELLQLRIDSLLNNNRIIILTNLPYSDLISYYKSAYALLIPLKNTVQDKARFPFKISEYLACQRPVITSAVGVVNDYLMDMKTAFVAVAEDINSFTEKMNFAMWNELIANEVGNNGCELSRKKFDNKLYITDVSNLIEIHK